MQTRLQCHYCTVFLNINANSRQVIERKKQIAIQEQEIVRKQRELDAQVIKPAEAEKYKIEMLANAEQ